MTLFTSIAADRSKPYPLTSRTKTYFLFFFLSGNILIVLIHNMSTFSTEQRPTMRRKSSAQNLLSSFKSTPSSSASAVPPPLNLGSTSAMNSTQLSFAAVATPTATTPLAREWDAQSLHSDTVASSMAGAQSPPLNQGTSVEYLRDLIQKRIITLTYIRSIHEGSVPSCHGS